MSVTLAGNLQQLLSVELEIALRLPQHWRAQLAVRAAGHQRQCEKRHVDSNRSRHGASQFCRVGVGSCPRSVIYCGVSCPYCTLLHREPSAASASSTASSSADGGVDTPSVHSLRRQPASTLAIHVGIAGGKREGTYLAVRRCMPSSTSSCESVAFHRHRAVGGVEVRAVGDSAFPWTFYSTDYEFLAPTSWSGEVFHRSATRPLEPGAVLCARPGELVTARSIRMAGARCSLVVEERTLAEFLDEHGRRERRVHVVPRAHMSPALQKGLAAVFLGFRSESGALELQAALVEFFVRAVPELFGHKSGKPTRSTAAPKAAARMRELLAESSADTIHFATLAREVGLSRFGALRAFKRQFGLPPHAYHLSMRLGLARRSLRRGRRPAEVAAEFGFVDQSHLTRHFRRVFGIPPAEYARAAAA